MNCENYDGNLPQDANKPRQMPEGSLIKKPNQPDDDTRLALETKSAATGVTTDCFLIQTIGYCLCNFLCSAQLSKLAEYTRRFAQARSPTTSTSVVLVVAAARLITLRHFCGLEYVSKYGA